MRTTLLFTALLVLLAVLNATASAQDAQPGDLALAIAMVAANEASLDASLEDVALIYQVARSHGLTDAQRLAWLRRHSSCILTDRPLSHAEEWSNCPWTRGLRDSDEQPAAWPRDWPVWRAYRDRWRQLRAWARALVAGELAVRPCPETPWTWGGRIIDMRQALRRGLRPVGCVGTSNEGFVRGDT